MQWGREESSMQTNAECQEDGVKAEVGEEARSMSPLRPTEKKRPGPKRTAARQQQYIDLTRARTRSRSAARQGQGRQATKCDVEPEAVDVTKLGNCRRLLGRGSVGLEENS